MLFRSDPHTFFHSFQYRYNRLPNICVADSGYGSEENYRFMQENGIEAFIKYNYFHKEQRPRYAPNPFHTEITLIPLENVTPIPRPILAPHSCA